MRFTGQIVYLTHALNDRFDPLNRAIYIDNVASVFKPFVYNKLEAKPPTYVYNKWVAGQSYSLNDKVSFGMFIWRSLTNSNQGNTPFIGSSHWAFDKNRLCIKNKAESPAVDFIVYVPFSLNFDINEMKALINYYKLAGKRYSIVNY
jgi:hypothetical protein